MLSDDLIDQALDFVRAEVRRRSVEICVDCLAAALAGRLVLQVAPRLPKDPDAEVSHHLVDALVWAAEDSVQDVVDGPRLCPEPGDAGRPSSTTWSNRCGRRNRPRK